MKQIIALEEYVPQAGEFSVFLAGGITGCEEWQSAMVALLEDTDLVLLNPRRANFPMDDPNAAHEQIVWEWKHLTKANAIIFWFPPQTLCPITLYELGRTTLASGHKLLVGVHPDYQRKLDIEVQLGLSRPDVKIVYSLEDLAMQVKELC